MENAPPRLLAHGHHNDFMADFKEAVKRLDCVGVYVEEVEGAKALLKFEKYDSVIVQVRPAGSGGASDLAFLKYVKSVKPGLTIIIASQFKRPKNPRLIEFIKEHSGVVFVHVGSDDSYLFNYLHHVTSVPLSKNDEGGEFILLERLRSYLSGSSICPNFQPIVNLKSRNVFAFEALARSRTQSLLSHPGILFDYAANKNMFAEIDYACIKESLLLSNSLPVGANLFLNVQPRSLSDIAFSENLISAIAESEIDASRVCIELTEQDEIRNYKMFHASLSRLREIGCMIAVDDVGEGNANLEIILHVNPEVLKISGKLIRHIESIPIVRSMVSSIVEISKPNGILTIAESIETEEQAEILRDLGVTCGQGWHFGRPVVFSPKTSQDNP